MDLGDSSRTSNQDDLVKLSAKREHWSHFSSHLVDITLLDVGILQYLLNGLHGLAEQIHVKFFELGSSQRFGEIISVLERLDFDPSRLLVRERALGLLNFSLQFSKGLEVLADVSSCLLLVLLGEVIHNAVVEIFTTEMSVASSCKDLEDTIIDREERNIEGSSTEIVDDDLRLSLLLLVQTVGDSGGRRLVDDTENLETSDGPSVLGGLSLSIIEIYGSQSDQTLLNKR